MYLVCRVYWFFLVPGHIITIVLCKAFLYFQSLTIVTLNMLELSYRFKTFIMFLQTVDNNLESVDGYEKFEIRQ